MSEKISHQDTINSIEYAIQRVMSRNPRLIKRELYKKVKAEGWKNTKLIKEALDDLLSENMLEERYVEGRSIYFANKRDAEDYVRFAGKRGIPKSVRYV